MRTLLLSISLAIVLTGCVENRNKGLTVEALPISAKSDGIILSGPSVLNDPDRFVWGGSVIKGDDNKYHMLYSTWECGDSIPHFSDAWVLHSKIAYAVSDYPDRDFQFRKIVLQGKRLEGDSSAWDAQMVHNPHIKKFKDKYYLYYGAGKDPGIQPQGTKGELVNKRNRVQQNQCIGVIEFNSFEELLKGEYKRFDAPILSPRTRVKPDHIVKPSPEGTEPKPDNIIVVNPSVVQRPSDGKYLLYFKGNFYNPGWRGVHGVAIADSPTGPFTATDHFVFDIRNEDGTIANGEDPFVWYHPIHKRFYVILKDFTGRITEGQPGLALLESKDGIEWNRPGDSFFMKKEVILDSGDTIHVNNLERPQLLLDEYGNPTVLYSACAITNIGPRTDGASFNVHIPFKKLRSKTRKKNSKLPNIIIIYADDMGYGDLNCQNEKSKIPTPNLDRLASEGMRFSDAHSSSGICSPSRFAMLTGTYHWRRQHDIVGAFGKPFFRENDTTLPQVLKTKGYATACIGKWHLGWDWEFQNEPSGEVEQWGAMRKVYLPEDRDWSKAIAGGPLERGFDYYFGDGTINFPPYAWVENDRFIELPTEEMKIHNIGYDTKEGEWEFRPGPKVSGWDPYQVLPTLTEKAREWINKQDKSQPFFLYFALPSPHAPIIPNDEFDGKSEAGAYGDFVFQSDWVVGQVLSTLIEKGLDDNTIVVFSSDNGPEAYAWKRAENFEHFSMGDFRGLKRDVWEGGHHVPFIIKWPGEIEAGSVSNEVISQVDLMATLTRIAGIELPDQSAPDSYNLLPILKGEEHRSPYREATVHNTYPNTWGIRKGDWLYIDGPSGGHREPPESFKRLKGYTDFSTEGLLFNLKQDPEQLVNLYEKYPEIIQEMDLLLQKYRESGSSIKQ